MSQSQCRACLWTTLRAPGDGRTCVCQVFRNIVRINYAQYEVFPVNGNVIAQSFVACCASRIRKGDDDRPAQLYSMTMEK